MSSPPSKRTLIEQAVARGETLDWICDNLNVSTRLVDATLRRMDELLAEPEPVERPRRPKRERRPRQLRPCGTHAAFGRHRARGETPCTECTEAEREYQRVRHVQRKRAERAA